MLKIEYRDDGGSVGLHPLYARVRDATRLIVQVRREMGEEGEELRSDVIADLKDAFVGVGPTRETMVIEGETRLATCHTPDGHYREIFADFGLDRSDQRLQETLFDMVRRTLDAELAG